MDTTSNMEEGGTYNITDMTGSSSHLVLFSAGKEITLNLSYYYYLAGHSRISHTGPNVSQSEIFTAAQYVANSSAVALRTCNNFPRHNKGYSRTPMNSCFNEDIIMPTMNDVCWRNSSCRWSFSINIHSIMILPDQCGSVEQKSQS